MPARGASASASVVSHLDIYIYIVMASIASFGETPASNRVARFQDQPTFGSAARGARCRMH
eukprot:4156809-Lingulodinium_polyedra.AAC.1